MIEAGATRPEIVARLAGDARKVQLVFVLETLEYLQRGGRIGKAQAFVGTLLKFKPLLGHCRGRGGSTCSRAQPGQGTGGGARPAAQGCRSAGSKVRMALTHALAPEEAWALGAKLSKAFETSELLRVRSRPVIGVHVGPGTIGAAAVALD